MLTPYRHLGERLTEPLPPPSPEPDVLPPPVTSVSTRDPREDAPVLRPLHLASMVLVLVLSGLAIWSRSTVSAYMHTTSAR